MAPKTTRKNAGLHSRKNAAPAAGRGRSGTARSSTMRSGTSRSETPQSSGRRAAGQRELFDVNAAPIQKSKSVRSDGMQQIILPMGIPTPQDEPQRTKNTSRKKSGGGKQKTRRGARQNTQLQNEAGERRRLTRGEQRRRRNRRRLILWMVLLGLLALGFFFSVNVLFKVEGYRLENYDGAQAENTGIYAQDTVISALNVPLGDNLFGFNLKEKAAAMEQTLPYLENIEIKRSLPGTIVIRVTPAVETYSVQGDFGWAVVSSGFKALAIQGEEPGSLIRLLVSLQTTPVAGQTLCFGTAAPESADSAGSDSASAEPAVVVDETGQALESLVTLLSAEQILGATTEIDLRDPQEITFTYADRVLVRLGTANNLDYKMQLAGYILRNEDGNCLDENDRGTLDVSHQKSDGTIKPVFSPENTVDITAAMTPQTEESAEETDGQDGGDAQTDAAA